MSSTPNAQAHYTSHNSHPHLHSSLARRALDSFSPSLSHDQHFSSPLVVPQLLQLKTHISLKLHWPMPQMRATLRVKTSISPRHTHCTRPLAGLELCDMYQLGRNRSFRMFHCVLFVLYVPFSVLQLPPLPSYVAASPSALLTMCPPGTGYITCVDTTSYMTYLPDCKYVSEYLTIGKLPNPSNCYFERTAHNDFFLGGQTLALVVFLHHLHPLVPNLTHLRLSELLAFDYNMAQALHSELAKHGTIPTQFPHLCKHQWNTEPHAMPIDWERSQLTSGSGLQCLAHVGNSRAMELMLMECMWSVPCQVQAAIGEPVNLGTTTSGSGSQRLACTAGNSYMMELVLTGRMWSATHQVWAVM